MVDILQMAFLKCIFFDENWSILIQITVHLFFLMYQLTKDQHWFRQWLSAKQTTSHWLVYANDDHVCMCTHIYVPADPIELQ